LSRIQTLLCLSSGSTLSAYDVPGVAAEVDIRQPNSRPEPGDESGKWRRSELSVGIGEEDVGLIPHAIVATRVVPVSSSVATKPRQKSGRVEIVATRATGGITDSEAVHGLLDPERYIGISTSARQRAAAGRLALGVARRSETPRDAARGRHRRRIRRRDALRAPAAGYRPKQQRELRRRARGRRGVRVGRDDPG
jgi:hypothetical protein